MGLFIFIGAMSILVLLAIIVLVIVSRHNKIGWRADLR